jgi:hypothetical protein
VTLRFDRPAGAGPPLKVTVTDNLRSTITTGEVRGPAEIPFTAEHYGIYFVRVEPVDPAAPWPEDTRYTLTVAAR